MSTETLATLATVGTVVVCLGAAVAAVGAFGVLRLPDVYSRLSALALGSGLGLVLVMIGLLLHFPSPANAVKIGLAIVIQLATAAVAGNVVSRSGYLTRAPRTPLTHTDELAEAGGSPEATGRPAGPAPSSEPDQG